MPDFVIVLIACSLGYRGNRELTRITTKSVLGRPSTEIVNFRRVPALARGVVFCLDETNLQTLVERDADNTQR